MLSNVHLAAHHAFAQLSSADTAGKAAGLLYAACGIVWAVSALLFWRICAQQLLLLADLVCFLQLHGVACWLCDGVH